MKRLFFGILALSLVYAGVVIDRRRRPTDPGTDAVDQWESEGGSVPEDSSHETAQTTAG